MRNEVLEIMIQVLENDNKNTISIIAQSHEEVYKYDIIQLMLYFDPKYNE